MRFTGYGTLVVERKAQILARGHRAREHRVMARSKSSKQWLAEHFDDHYVKLAQRQGLRSRSAFKLIELQEKYRLVRPGMTVVDLGAAPGGWCQVLQPLVGSGGRIIALDLLPMEPVPGVFFIHGDFTEDGPLQELEAALDGAPADLVLSDMAPNIRLRQVVAETRRGFCGEAVPGNGFRQLCQNS
jgi:23S rRNA (uridine2552-2'-O)-methyltransferase